MARRKPILAATAFWLVATLANAAENPMWRTSFRWSCSYSSVIRCERSQACLISRDAGFVILDYRENRVEYPVGTYRAIRRHYVQSVSGNPLGAEVKIELETNEVVSLAAVDSSSLFSHDWLGTLISPKGGVVLQELRPLVCEPAK